MGILGKCGLEHLSLRHHCTFGDEILQPRNTTRNRAVSIVKPPRKRAQHIKLLERFNRVVVRSHQRDRKSRLQYWQKKRGIFGRQGYQPRWIRNNTKVGRAYTFSRQFLIIEVTPQAKGIENLNNLLTYLFSHNGVPDSLSVMYAGLIR